MRPRLPGASQHHSCFAVRSRANAFCHSRLQTRIAGASNQIDQRSCSADSGDDSALLRSPQLFRDFYVKLSSRYSLVRILPASSSKSPPNASDFNILKCKSSSRYSFVHILRTNFADRGPQPRLLRRPQEPRYPKNQGCLPENVFTREVTRVPNYLMIGGWHDDVVDMMVGMLTMAIVRNSDVSN